MPTYDYRCRKCGHVFEVVHGMSDDKPRRCPRCKSRAVRVPGGGAGLLFKGSGFYITDYRSSSYKEKAKSEKPARPEGSGKSEGGKSEGGKSGGAKSGDAKPGGSSTTPTKKPAKGE